MDEFNIDNRVSDVATWKPYNFMQYIEQELSLRGVEYLVTDLTMDLGYLKTCIKYAESIGKTRVALIKYFIWLFDGIQSTQLTSLDFTTRSLKAFFGSSKPVPVPKKKSSEKEPNFLNPAAKKWLDDLKQQHNS